MAIQDIPVFREARRGQVLRSDDWNSVQRELRQGIRGHRHTRLANAPPNDASAVDLGVQITTNEIADGAVTAAKLAPDALDNLSLTRATERTSFSPPTGTVDLEARSRHKVRHGLGSVPVGVVLGVHQRVSGLRGEYEVYGAASVIAAVPRKPDGTFTLVSTSDTAVTVRWWAVMGEA
jgi:hypothetical protein